MANVVFFLCSKIKYIMEQLIAHRGLKINGTKENTIQAFKNAIDNPFYGGFECDIRTTKDNVFVINHNPIIGADIISLSKYQELKDKYHIPTLESVLKLKTNKIMLLEIKEINIDIKAFQDLIHKYSNKNIYVMSFFNKVIQKLKQRKENEKLGVLNYLLNSEESYEEYDFICILENVMSKKIEEYFRQKEIAIFLYGIHQLDKTIKLYPNNHYITDEIKLR